MIRYEFKYDNPERYCDGKGMTTTARLDPSGDESEMTIGQLREEAVKAAESHCAANGWVFQELEALYITKYT